MLTYKSLLLQTYDTVKPTNLLVTRSIQIRKLNVRCLSIVQRMPRTSSKPFLSEYEENRNSASTTLSLSQAEEAQESSRNNLRTLSFKHVSSISSDVSATPTMTNTTTSFFNKQAQVLDEDIESSRRPSRSNNPNKLSKSKSSRSQRSSTSRSSRRDMRRQEQLKEFEPPDNDYMSIEELVDDEVYVVKQEKGHFSIYFSMVQTLVLTVMMIQCTIAPLNINPMIGPPPDALDYWGGKNAVKILDEGETWRLITPIFLHAGVIHLFCNVSVQLDIGAFFEREWGSGIWLFVYLTSAVGSSIFSVCFKPDNVSVGSSGAVMGLFGAKLGEIFCRSCESKKNEQGRVGHIVRNEQFSSVMCSVVVVMAFSFVPYVDWAAHLGGLVAGFAAAFLCFAPKIKTKHYAVFWFCVGVAMNLVLYITSISYMYTDVEPMQDLKDVCNYFKQYFQDYECQCQKD